MKNETAINPQLRINAAILKLVASRAPTGPGVVQGTRVIILPTKSNFVANHAIQAFNTGTPTNGINNSGFITIGAPNIIGSLILNTAGITDSFPIDLICAFYSQT